MITATVWLLLNLRLYTGELRLIERFPTKQACEDVRQDLLREEMNKGWVLCQKAVVAVVPGGR